MMINFKRVSGLSLHFDNNFNNIVFEPDVDSEGKIDINIDHLRGELLNSALTCPKLFCTQYLRIDQRNLMKKRNLRYDLVVIPPNLAGIEYVKNKGHYNDLVTSRHSSPELVEVLYGWASVLLQRPRVKPSNNGTWSSINDMYDFPRLEDVIVFKLQRGDKLIIPSGWGHVFINTRQTPLVFAMIRNTREFMIRRFIPEKGAGYYFIRKNARQEVVRNPKYKEVPTYRRGTIKFALKEFQITEKTPIFRQVARSSEKFNWLLKPSLVNWNKIISSYIE